MIITNNDAALRIKCEDVLPDEIGPLRDQLERELIHSAELGKPGVGLAAIQIGIPKKFAICRLGNGLDLDLINCEIIKGYDKAIFEGEGCLSYPGMIESTYRYQEIYVENNDVEPISFVASGLLAVVIQHELDHCGGIILPDISIKKPNLKIKIRPNDSCICGSKLKYKKCCQKNLQ